MHHVRRRKLKEGLETFGIAATLFAVTLLLATKTEAALPAAGGINLAPPPISAGSSLFTEAPTIDLPKTLPSPTQGAQAVAKAPVQSAAKVTTSAIEGLLGLTPFGGRVITIHPNICGGMVHITVQTSLGGTVDLMTTGATRFYKSGPPTNPGQNVLGLYAPTQVTCSPTRFVSYSGGAVIMMGSSSLIPDPEDIVDKVKSKAKSFLGS